MTDNVQLVAPGLTTEDIICRPLTSVEAAACQVGGETEGWVFPYYNFYGKPMAFYRVRVTPDNKIPVYHRLKDMLPRVYCPPGVADFYGPSSSGFSGAGFSGASSSSRESGDSEVLQIKPLFITVGEENTAVLMKYGFPAVGIPDVDQWYTRRFNFPKEVKINQAGERTRVEIPSHAMGTDELNSQIIEGSGAMIAGLIEVIDYAVKNQLTIVIVFPTSNKSEPHVNEVLAAKQAALLGYELRFRGLQSSQIRSLVLPNGLSPITFIASQGLDEFKNMVRRVLTARSAFPRHPNPRKFVASKLQRGRVSRKEQQDIALSMLTELDHQGRRLRNEDTKETYYFDTQEHLLMHVALANPKIMLHETSFGEHLYRRFGLGGSDQKVVGWLATQFTGEAGVEEARMWRVLARTGDDPDIRGIAYQLSDTHFVLVRGNPNKPFEILENGEYGILFEQSCVEPIDSRKFETQLELEKGKKLSFDTGWFKVLEHFNIRTPDDDEDSPVLDEDGQVRRFQQFIALLYYISPWLLRWKGTQLPVELLIGEAGSGKSSIYELRQSILTGKPKLSNMPHDMKDWYAGITSVGGLHVMDNVAFTVSGQDLKRRISDELCRLTTESDPHIEMRRLYTTADVYRQRVNTCFAMTAIQQPFNTTDLLQRAALFEVKAVGGEHDANWVKHRLQDMGGRARWVAHHLVVLQKFLERATWSNQWDAGYKASHRLANYEQALRMMASVFGMEDTDWIPELLMGGVARAVSEGDWVIAGLQQFIKDFKDEHEDWVDLRFAVSDICSWAKDHEQMSSNRIMSNPWQLGKHITSHQSTITRVTGIEPAGKQNNRKMFRVQSVQMVTGE